MKLIDIIRMAFANLCRSKTRTFLTMSGMVIGTISVIIMISLGIGMREATVQTYSEAGSLSTISVNPSMNTYGNNSKKLNASTVRQLKDIDTVVAVMPMVTVDAVIKSGTYVYEATILAYDDSYAAFDFELSSGKMPSRRSGGNYEIVMSSWAYESFHSPGKTTTAVDVYGNPKVTKDSKLSLTFDESVAENISSGASLAKSYNLTVTGVLSEECSDYCIYCIMSLEDLKRLVRENSDYVNINFNEYDEIQVKCSSFETASEVRKKIDSLGYETFSLQEAIEAAESSTKQTLYMLVAIGFFSILISALSIANTMLMSILERKKEIGIFKALGCTENNILNIFIAEAACIGVFGGALGAGLSYIVSYIVNVFMEGTMLSSVIPIYLPLAAVGIALLISIISGIYPAIKAMKMSPLSAIRNE